jgi:hypothetical protein
MNSECDELLTANESASYDPQWTAISSLDRLQPVFERLHENN